jgi:hypothetical protein
MSLSLFAAETLVVDYLNGRAMPCNLHRAAVLAAEFRLVNGLVPVLDQTLCATIEEAATGPPTWSTESILRAVQERRANLRMVPQRMRTLQSG